MDEFDFIDSLGPSNPTPPISTARTLSERFQRIRAAYREHQCRVDAGKDSWGVSGDPYSVADWVPIFTPIEAFAWSDIRSFGLPLWPQFPVDRYFVDFGNPVAKVALECDGEAWHRDKERDRQRDSTLAAQGWTVFRAPGWKCRVDFDRPNDWDDMDDMQRSNWDADMHERSLRPIMYEILRICESRGLMERAV